MGIIDKADIGVIIQIVNFQTGEKQSSSAQIPFDDSIPQKTEGFEIMTLSITPKKANSKLKIDVFVMLGNTASAQYPTIALFQDDLSNAIAVSHQVNSTSDRIENQSFCHFMPAGSIAQKTFKVRVGGTGSITNVNGVNAGRRFGGKMSTSITISEILA